MRQNAAFKLAAFLSINTYWICLFASPISWFLKFAGVALSVWLGAMKMTALQGIDRAFEEAQRNRWLDELTSRNLLRAIREGRADDWLDAIQASTTEAAEDIGRSRDSEMMADELATPSAWIYWPAKIIFVGFLFLLDMALCALAGDFLASLFR